MEKLPFTHGFSSETNATRPWRPWIHKSSHERRTNASKPYERAPAAEQLLKAPEITHPVKTVRLICGTHVDLCRLFWPRSRCFDYLYLDAEVLLRSYPVQATICLCEDSESEDDEEDEEPEKNLS
ncbi:protein ripply2 [Carassius carassius]|uniref:protein ripply2 n=1 Tax=Carassius carassius TaxID=217509 RepID=UPI0028693F01|nr:protein ripply2 [Carassius carassius]